jgi:hypothetical protein
MISKWGNLFSRYVAGLYTVRDCTAGFRAIRASIIKQIDLDALGVRGYAFQLALLNQALLKRARVAEVPVEFVDRVEGTTKMRMADIVEFMLNSWKIRFENSKTFMKFAGVGLSGLLVNLASFTVLIHAGLHKFLASPLAIEVSIITNFLLNNAWTLSEAGQVQPRLPGRARRKLLHVPCAQFPVSAGLAAGASGHRHHTGHARQLCVQFLVDLPERAAVGISCSRRPGRRKFLHAAALERQAAHTPPHHPCLYASRPAVHAWSLSPC